VSLISGLSKEPYNMDRLLHRGQYAVEGEAAPGAAPDDEGKRGWAIFGMGKDFTRNDRIVFIFSYSYTLLVTVVFVVGTAYMLGVGISDQGWADFWWYYCIVMLGLTVVVTVWVAAGGIKNLKELKESLENLVRDEADDGTVVGDVSLADLKHRAGDKAD